MHSRTGSMLEFSKVYKSPFCGSQNNKAIKFKRVAKSISSLFSYTERPFCRQQSGKVTVPNLYHLRHNGFVFFSCYDDPMRTHQAADLELNKKEEFV